MKKELAATAVALALAFVVVQGASLLQTFSTVGGAMNPEYATTAQEPRVQATQPPVPPRLQIEQIAGTMLASLIIATSCYLFIRRHV